MSSPAPAAAASSSAAALAAASEPDYGPTPAANPASLPNSPDGKRFLYFAYGSNLLPSILTLKSVHVHSARSGFLQDVQLLFDLKVSSIVEPCYANLRRVAGARTHGVVYELEAKDMETMDRMEGNGRSYVREEFECSLYHAGEAAPGDSGEHEKVRVSAYICHADNLSKTVLQPHPPSRRYLDVLIQGCKHHKLDAAYVAWMESHEFTPLPKLEFTAEQKAAIESKSFTQAELESFAWRAEFDDAPCESWATPLLMSMKGVVFDIRMGRYGNAWKKNQGGKDLTMFTAGRIATDAHALPKCPADFTPQHQAYVDATLVDLANQYPIVGHMQDRAKYW